MSVCLSVTRSIVAKRYILQQKCLNKWIGSALLRARSYSCQPLHLSYSFKVPEISKGLTLG